MGYLDQEESEEGRRKALRGGIVVCAIYFVLTAVAAFFWMPSTIPGVDEGSVPGAETIVLLSFFALMLLFTAFTGWRFYIGRGFISGTVFLILISLSFISSIAQSSFGGLGISILMAFFMFRAVKAAHSMRSVQSADVDVTDTFS